MEQFILQPETNVCAEHQQKVLEMFLRSLHFIVKYN